MRSRSTYFGRLRQLDLVANLGAAQLIQGLNLIPVGPFMAVGVPQHAGQGHWRPPDRMRADSTERLVRDMVEQFHQFLTCFLQAAADFRPGVAGSPGHLTVVPGILIECFLIAEGRNGAIFIENAM